MSGSIFVMLPLGVPLVLSKKDLTIEDMWAAVSAYSEEVDVKKHFSFRYVDEDNDTITLSTQDELDYVLGSNAIKTIYFTNVFAHQEQALDEAKAKLDAAKKKFQDSKAKTSSSSSSLLFEPTKSTN